LHQLLILSYHPSLSAQAYFEQHGIAAKMDALVKQMAVEKPSNPDEVSS